MIKMLPLLCWEFFKTGLFAVGGGLATLPFLYDMARRFGWFTVEELTDMIAVSESTPGPIGVNMATYAGYAVAGVPGAVAATISLVVPSVAIIVLVSRFLDRFRSSKSVEDAFAGLRPAVTGLICAAAYQVFSMTLLTPNRYAITHKLLDYVSLLGLGLFAVFAAVLVKTKCHPIVVISAGALLGIVLKL